MDDTNNTASSLPRGHSLNSFGFSGKIMLISVVIFFSVCFIMAFFHSYARWVLHRRSANFRRHRHQLRRAHQLAAVTGPHQGLDPTVLKSLPTFLYASAAHSPPLECAVCLSEFEDKETGRVLPKCNHCFHVDCIDMWFHSHSNCPICRAPVQPGIRVQVQPARDTDFTVISVSEAKSSATHCPDSSSSGPVDEGRKLPESTTVHVDVRQ